jgi:hypothetical protein
MGRATDKNKQEFAYILYMSGEMQKTICERVGITPRTLIKYVESGGWKVKRAARTITKTELINKTLSSIGQLLDRALANPEDEKSFDSLSDKLSKLAKTITALEKTNTVVNDMETFQNFIKHLQNRLNTDNEIDIEFIKKINRYQDKYIKERLTQKQ